RPWTAWATSAATSAAVAHPTRKGGCEHGRSDPSLSLRSAAVRLSRCRRSYGRLSSAGPISCSRCGSDSWRYLPSSPDSIADYGRRRTCLRLRRGWSMRPLTCSPPAVKQQRAYRASLQAVATAASVLDIGVRKRARKMSRKISPGMARVERRALSMLSSDPTKRQGPPARLEDLLAEALLEHAEQLLRQIAGDGTAPEEAKLLAQVERLIERARQINDATS